MADDGFELFRVHAFSVVPCRTTTKLAEAEDLPEGGSIQISAALRDVLSESDDLLQSQAIAVDLAVDTESRTSAIREILLRYAFGATQTPVSAGQELAAALADAMDARSTACLLVIAGYRREDERRVSMWTFPREEAFQFKKSGRAPSIELLHDIFSRRSRLRKGATFSGKERPQDFIRGGVLDFQATSRSHLAADFWIVQFLRARLALQSNTATRHLVAALQSTFEQLELPAHRAQVHTGIMALLTGPQKRWSMRGFADAFLDNDAREGFLRNANGESVDQVFAIDRAVIEAKLRNRVFELESGVLVTAPFNTVGEDVQVQGKNLRVSGIIKREKMRGRR